MVHLYRRRFPVAQSAEQIFNAMLRDARNVNHTRAKALKRAFDAARAEAEAANRNYQTAPVVLKSAREIAFRHARSKVAQAEQDIVNLIKSTGAQIMPPSAPIRPLPPRTAIVGKPRKVATQAQVQLAAQIKMQRSAVLAAKREVFNAPSPAAKALAQTRLLEQAKRLAVLVPGKRRKTSALIAISPALSKVELAKEQAKIRSIQAQIAKLTSQHGTVQPAAMIRQVQLNHLHAQLEAAQLRTRRLSRGVVRRKPQRLPPHSIPVPRPHVHIPHGVPVAPSPLSVQQGLANLIPALPKKPGESAEAYRNRLEAYLQRLIARLVALLADGQDESTALEKATTQTLTEDQSALESEAKAGGVAPDPAADAVADVVEGAAGQALDTIEEQVAQSDSATTDDVDELIVQAEGAEAQLSEGSTPSDLVPSVDGQALDPAVTEYAPPAANGSGTTTGTDTQTPTDYTLPTVEGKPLWKHPVVIGGAILAGLFLLRR